MTVSWLPEINPCRIIVGARGGPQDNRVSFEPEVGDPIERPRTTGYAETFSIALPSMTVATYEAFETWFRSETKGGALPFVFRHPITTAVVRARIVKGQPPFTAQRAGSNRVSVQTSIMTLPGTPWWAPYVRDGAAQLPAFVADYENSVYGIADGKVPASDLPSISGTFDLYTTNTSDIETLQASHLVTAGDITEAQPGGVNRYVGFSV